MIDYKSVFDVTKLMFIYLFIYLGFYTLYRSYHDGSLEGQRKPVHTVRQGSVL